MLLKERANVALSVLKPWIAKKSDHESLAVVIKVCMKCYQLWYLRETQPQNEILV